MRITVPADEGDIDPDTVDLFDPALLDETVRVVEEFEVAGPIEHLESNFVAGVKRPPLTARLRNGGEQLPRDAAADELAGVRP